MKTRVTIAAVLLFGSSAAAAQQNGAHKMPGMDMQSMPSVSVQSATRAPSTPPLRERGEAAFAAIAEATAALESDPATDWSKVDIDALRQHLVDMDNVTVRSDVADKNIAMGERFEITSADPSVRDSIDRMVRLHAAMANSEGPYHLVVDAIPAGSALTVTGWTAADQAKIRGLGFFGLLTEGMHHQLHHLMLAKGEPMHH